MITYNDEMELLKVWYLNYCDTSRLRKDDVLSTVSFFDKYGIHKCYNDPNIVMKNLIDTVGKE